jgi:hypothetical protein
MAFLQQGREKWKVIKRGWVLWSECVSKIHILKLIQKYNLGRKGNLISNVIKRRGLWSAYPKGLVEAGLLLPGPLPCEDTVPLPSVGSSIQGAILQAETRASPHTKPAGTLIWGFQASRTMINKYLLFRNDPVSGILLQQHDGPRQ